MYNIALYLMGEKGLYIIEEYLINPNICKLEYVVGARDKQIQNDYFDDIKMLASKNGIQFFERGVDLIPQVNIDFYFAIGWRWIIKECLDKLIVFHDSLLPKYRGFNPLVTALIEGDTKIGVTSIFADENFDTGNIIGYKSIDIEYPIKIQKAISEVGKLYGKLFRDLLNKIANNNLTEVVQDNLNATYSLWRDEDDYLVDWNLSSVKIKRFIDSVGYPYNGAKTRINEQELTILDSEIYEDLKVINRTPGKILFINNNEPVVVCASGLLILKNVIERNTNQPYIFKKTRTRLK